MTSGKIISLIDIIVHCFPISPLPVPVPVPICLPICLSRRCRPLVNLPLPTERPDVPEEFSVLNVTESSAEIRWREPFNGNAVIVSYAVEYRLLDIDPASSAPMQPAPGSASSSPTATATVPIDRVTTNGSLRSTIVSGLRSSTFYNIRISAHNQIGQSDFTVWTRLRTEQSAPESPPIDVTATPTGPNSVKITWKVSNDNYMLSYFLEFITLPLVMSRGTETA